MNDVDEALARGSAPGVYTGIRLCDSCHVSTAIVYLTESNVGQHMPNFVGFSIQHLVDHRSRQTIELLGYIKCACSVSFNAVILYNCKSLKIFRLFRQREEEQQNPSSAVLHAFTFVFVRVHCMQAIHAYK